MSSFDLYQTVSDQIVAMLEAGVVPWRSPILGRSKAGHPKNLNTGKTYRGVNVFLLAFTAFAKGYGSSFWLTLNQANERGGNVRKGEKSSMTVFWKKYGTIDRQTGEPIAVPVLRYFNVFNVEQMEGIEIPDAVKFEPLDFQPIEAAEKLAAGFIGGPAVTHDGGQQAYYRPATDTVHMPERTRFASVEEFYSTLFHELSHNADSRIMPSWS
jgi:antirestriction protein ArdC